jgi:hypothetical protein
MRAGSNGGSVKRDKGNPLGSKRGVVGKWRTGKKN